MDDLLKVKGIGEKTLQKIKDQGLAYVGKISNEVTESTPVTTQETVVTAVYSTGVIINEFLPAPEGADEENEYIEIYNTSEAEVDISNWKLQDIHGTPKTFVFNANTKLRAGEYLTLKRPQTNIILNNDEDGLKLLSPDGKIVDSVSFTKAITRQSYNKTASGWKWSTTLTPGVKNIITGIIKTTKATKKSAKILPSAQKTDNKYLSAISQSPDFQPKAGPPLAENLLLLFLVVLISAIILGAIVLFLKLKLIKKDILN